MWRIRQWLSKVKMAPTDEELGRRQSVYPADGRRSSQYPEETPSIVLENSEKLMEFRMLVGSKLATHSHEQSYVFETTNRAAQLPHTHRSKRPEDLTEIEDQ